MASKFTQLIAVAALAGGMYVVAGGQPQRAAPPPVSVVTPAAKSAPPTRTNVHRNTHRPIPKSAKRKVWPKLPSVKPIPPIAREEKRERGKRKAKAKPASYCDALRARYANIIKTRLLTCAEMKAGQRCQRPGDEARASAAQKAAGAACYLAGQL